MIHTRKNLISHEHNNKLITQSTCRPKGDWLDRKWKMPF